ncbi:MAG: biopolymer transporter ExbD [Rhizobiaceae bacterium]|nr:biopolymer transporter ExbD [Rhizobiaceae bacterium]
MSASIHRRRRVVFVLTPLIDVIFLLLIFFMLSSQIAPYSLLPIGRIVGQAAGDMPSAPAEGTLPSMTLRVAHGFVAAGEERIPIPDLAATAERLRGEGISSYVLIASSAAQVQDMVSVMEALGRSEAAVTMLHAQAGAP